MSFNPFNVGVVSQMLSDAGQNSANSRGQSALYRAASTEFSPDYTKLLKLLLDYGAEPEPTEFSLYKPFNAVVQYGDLEAVELMINRGIDPANYVDEVLLHKAAVNPRTEVLEYLLCTGHFDPDQPDFRNCTALFKAVQANNPDAVEVLLNWGAQPNYIDGEGLTPLHHVKYETDENTTKCIEILLRNGARGDAVGQKDRTALYWACWHGSEKYSSEYTKRLKLFLEHGAASKLDHSVYQAFTAVVEFGNLEDVQLFLKHGVKLTKCKEDNIAIVHFSSTNPRTEILDYVLSTGIFDPSKADQTTLTPLHVAVQARNPGTVKLLLEAGVEVDPVDRGGFTPFLYAAYHAGMTQLEQSSDPYGARAIKMGGEPNASSKCIELLLAHGADVNFKLSGNDFSALETSLHGDVRWHVIGLEKFPEGALHIISHAVLMQSQGRHVNPRLLCLTKKNEACQAELDLLKQDILAGSASLYDLMTGRKSLSFCNKAEWYEKLSDPEYSDKLPDRFPIYGTRLIENIRYQIVKETAAEKLSKLLGFQRDSFHLIIEKIMSMLTRRDVRAVSRL